MLEVELHRLGTHGAQIVGVLRVADEPDGHVTALCQQPLQHQRDLPVPTRDDDS